MLLSLKIAADRLGLSRRTLEREIAAGNIPVVEIRRAKRIDEADLPTYIENHKSTKEIPCPSDLGKVSGMCVFSSAAKKSSDLLDRLLAKKTPKNSKQNSVATSSPMNLAARRNAR